MEKNKRIKLSMNNFKYMDVFNGLIPYIAEYNRIIITRDVLINLCHCTDFTNSPNCKVYNDNSLDFLGFNIDIEK